MEGARNCAEDRARDAPALQTSELIFPHRSRGGMGVLLLRKLRHRAFQELARGHEWETESRTCVLNLESSLLKRCILYFTKRTLGVFKSSPSGVPSTEAPRR